MGRLVLAGALLAAALGNASAGPTRKVQVQSDPEGAAVYIGDVDSGVACEPTPCTIEAPVGNPLIIVRKDGFEPEFVEVEVTKGKRPLQQKFKLKSAVGTIKVDSPPGALVRVNKEDKGKAPVDIPAPAGTALHVVVVSNGKTVYDDIVELETNQEFVVKPKTAAAADDATTITDDPEDSEGGGGGGSTGGGSAGAGAVTSTAPRKPRAAYVSVGLAFDVGFRHVTYQGATAMSTNLREEVEGGQVLAGPAIELWPGRMAGLHPLRGLSLFVRYQHPIVGKTVEGNLMGEVRTKWQSFEASLRQRWVFKSIGIEVGGGFVQESMGFEFSDTRDRDQLPVANYQSLRIGGKLSFIADNIEPFVTVETRLVQSGGLMAERFDTAKAGGVRGSAGLLLRLGAIAARVEGSLMRYSWTFTYDGSNDVAQATGATDSVQLISAFLGYSY
jgi:hypothetical protein